MEEAPQHQLKHQIQDVTKRWWRFIPFAQYCTEGEGGAYNAGTSENINQAVRSGGAYEARPFQRRSHCRA